MIFRQNGKRLASISVVQSSELLRYCTTLHRFCGSFNGRFSSLWILLPKPFPHQTVKTAWRSSFGICCTEIYFVFSFLMLNFCCILSHLFTASVDTYTTCVHAQNSPHSSSCFNLYNFPPLSHRFFNVCPEMVNVEVRPRLLTQIEGGLLVFFGLQVQPRVDIFFIALSQ